LSFLTLNIAETCLNLATFCLKEYTYKPALFRARVAYIFPKKIAVSFACCNIKLTLLNKAKIKYVNKKRLEKSTGKL